MVVSGASQRAPEDPLEPVTTVSLPVAQFIARQKPFVADLNVPLAACRDRSLTDWNPLHY